METSPQAFKLIALKAIKGIGPAALKEICRFINLDRAEMINSIARKYPCVSEESFTMGESYAENQIKTAKKLGHKIICFLDAEYPKSLKGLASSPLILFVAGEIEFLNHKNLAVIGTREPTKHGVRIAEKITHWFCDNGWNIVSGLAKGVDTLAHKSCIEKGMRTTAVLAHGLDVGVYPKENSKLAEDIIKSGGALVSEYPYGTTLRPAQLVQRDKIQAALSAGVILVQSGENGGSLHASREIIRYDRPLIVVGQSSHDSNSFELKAMANFILLGDDKGKACNLLKTKFYPNELLIKMHSSKEYPNTLEALEKSFTKIDANDFKKEISSNGILQF